ncbi:hypothetical protein [Nannocystis pusilla]|uniref:hypothetical protein n=1 Tax=Nannocystis pusilla TaxID=889268 RepID=UPI003B7E68E4
MLDVDDFTGMISLAMRSLATGETLWTEAPVESGNLVEWSPTQEYDVVVDPRGDGLALRTPTPGCSARSSMAASRAASTPATAASAPTPPTAASRSPTTRPSTCGTRPRPARARRASPR